MKIRGSIKKNNWGESREASYRQEAIRRLDILQIDPE